MLRLSLVIIRHLLEPLSQPLDLISDLSLLFVSQLKSVVLLSSELGLLDGVDGGVDNIEAGRLLVLDGDC